MPRPKRPRLQHRNGHQARKLRARILAAYDTCARCGGPVDKTLPANDPMAPQVGHKHPYSRGGTDDWDNLQLEHRACNLRAGASMPGDPGQTSGKQATRAAALPVSQKW